MHIATNGVMTHRLGQTNLTLTLSEDLVVDEGGVLTVNGKGYQHAGLGVGNGPGRETIGDHDPGTELE